MSNNKWIIPSFSLISSLIMSFKVIVNSRKCSLFFSVSLSRVSSRRMNRLVYEALNSDASQNRNRPRFWKTLPLAIISRDVYFLFVCQEYDSSCSLWLIDRGTQTLKVRNRGINSGLFIILNPNNPNKAI